MSDEQIIPPARPQRTMMVKNLVPRLPDRGRIKIGELGQKRTAQSGREYGLPKKLSYFKITTLQRDGEGNFVMDKALHDKLGLGDEPTEIPVRLLYDSVELNGPTRYAAYFGKTLFCSGDGETAHRISNRAGDKPIPGGVQVQCPCHRVAPEYNGKDKCKLNIALSVLIDGAGGVGGVWTLRSTSWNTTTGLLSSMAFIRSITGGILANIPLKMRIQPKQATNPNDQSSVLIYVVSLEFAGDIAELQQIGHQIALDRATTKVSIQNIEEEARRLLSLPLPENVVLPGDDDPEAFAAEFYPEAAEEMASMPAVPRPTRDQFDDDVDLSGPVPFSDEPPPPYDGETGEIIENSVDVPEKPAADEIEVLGRAVTAAKNGTESFRAFWTAATHPERTVLLPDLVKYQQIAEEADTAAAAPPQTESLPEIAQGATAPPERPALFALPSWRIKVPKHASGKVNYPVLRDQMMSLVPHCQSGAELDKLAADNQAALDDLKRAAPVYFGQVNEVAGRRRQKLNG